VETHEPQVLKGMGKYLALFRPAMIIEVLNEVKAEELNGLFAGMDYLYFNIDEEKNNVRRTDRLTKSDYWNFLLCNRSTAQLLKLI
jgi:hypothetical protein